MGRNAEADGGHRGLPQGSLPRIPWVPRGVERSDSFTHYRPPATTGANADANSTRRGAMCVLAGERSRGSGDSTSATTRAVSAAAYALDGEGAALRSVVKPGRGGRAVPHEPRAECRGSKIALLVVL